MLPLFSFFQSFIKQCIIKHLFLYIIIVIIIMSFIGVSRVCDVFVILLEVFLLKVGVIDEFCVEFIIGVVRFFATWGGKFGDIE